MAIRFTCHCDLFGLIVECWELDALRCRRFSERQHIPLGAVERASAIRSMIPGRRRATATPSARWLLYSHVSVSGPSASCCCRGLPRCRPVSHRGAPRAAATADACAVLAASIVLRYYAPATARAAKLLAMSSRNRSAAIPAHRWTKSDLARAATPLSPHRRMNARQSGLPSTPQGERSVRTSRSSVRFIAWPSYLSPAIRTPPALRPA